MKFDFELALDDCLTQMQAGKTLEECLKVYPTQAEKLRPLLQSAAQVWELPMPQARPAAFHAGLERMLSAAKLQQVAPDPVSSGPFARYTKSIASTLKTTLYGKTHSSLNQAFRLGIALIFVLFAASTVIVRASATSLPGDNLYQVKRSWESMRLSLTPGRQSKQELLDEFAGERREEVNELIQLHRVGTVEFQAPLEKMDAQLWRVDGFQVQIDPETEVQGQPETGESVDIRARLDANGDLFALQVSVPTELPSMSKPAITVYPSATARATLTTGLTPQSDEDSETQDSEFTQHQQEPGQTPRPTDVREEQETPVSIRPTQASDREATDPPQTHPEHTAEHTEHPEMEHTPQPADTHPTAHPSEPTYPPRNP